MLIYWNEQQPYCSKIDDENFRILRSKGKFLKREAQPMI